MNITGRSATIFVGMVLWTGAVAFAQDVARPAPPARAEVRAPSTPPAAAKLSATLDPVRQYVCKPAVLTDASAAQKASCAPSGALSCPASVRFEQGGRRAQECAVSCTLSAQAARCDCTIDLAACRP